MVDRCRQLRDCAKAIVAQPVPSGAGFRYDDEFVLLQVTGTEKHPGVRDLQIFAGLKPSDVVRYPERSLIYAIHRLDFVGRYTSATRQPKDVYLLDIMRTRVIAGGVIHGGKQSRIWPTTECFRAVRARV